MIDVIRNSLLLSNSNYAAAIKTYQLTIGLDANNAKAWMGLAWLIFIADNANCRWQPLARRFGLIPAASRVWLTPP